MNIKLNMYNTLPNSKAHWWQVVLLPTVSVMNNIQKYEPYIAFNFEWLFWSFTIIITYGEKQQESNTYIFKG
jgi:hypothetical protein